MISEKKFGFKLAIALFLVILCFSLLFIGFNIAERYIIKNIDTKNFSDLPDDIFGRVKYNDETYKPKTRIENILLIGLDDMGTAESSDAYTNSQQADFLALLVMDKKAREYTLIHINRDTMADIPVLGVNGDKVGTLNTQIALSHTYGKGLDDSCRNTREAVSDLLCGVRIDSYISLTMGAVGTLNDLIGGVEVEVLDDFSEVDSSLVKGQTVKLQSEQALEYVRFRKDVGDQTNLARMERQKQYISAFLKTFESEYEKDSKLVLKSVDAASEYMVTDMTVQEMANASECLSEYSFTGIISPEGESTVNDGHVEYHVDNDALMRLVLNVFYQRV